LSKELNDINSCTKKLQEAISLATLPEIPNLSIHHNDNALMPESLLSSELIAAQHTVFFVKKINLLINVVVVFFRLQCFSQ